MGKTEMQRAMPRPQPGYRPTPGPLAHDGQCEVCDTFTNVAKLGALVLCEGCAKVTGALHKSRHYMVKPTAPPPGQRPLPPDIVLRRY